LGHEELSRELSSALRREQRITTALRHVATALRVSTSLDELLEVVLRKMRDVVEAERATIYLVDGTELVSKSRSGPGAEKKAVIRLKVGEGIAGACAATKKPVFVPCAYEDPRFSKKWDKLTGFRTNTILAVPILNHEGSAIGVAQVLNKADGEFTEEDASTLESLASQAAVSIEHFSLLSSLKDRNAELREAKEQLESRVRDLKLLFDLESAMARVATLDELLIAVIGEAKRVCKAAVGAFALRDPESEICTLHVLQRGRIRRFVMAEGEGLIGAAMVSDEVIMTHAPRADDRLSTELDERVGFHCENALCVPLDGPDGFPIGAFGLYNKRSGVPFDDNDRALVLLIAANASTAIRLHWSRAANEREERLTTIGRLLSGVLHDLKTPLSVISGYVQLMQGAAERPQRDEYAAMVFKQFEHIGAMQRDVLEFARGEKSVLVRKVYLAPFFEEVRKTLETSLAKSGVELVIDLLDRGTARFDEARMLRVIHNLARNAAEAMGAQGGGRFTIKVQRDKHSGSILMSFSDTGPGIPKEIEHRLFGSFVTSGKKGGTGLGLAIVKRVAEEHGGSVSVHSSKRGATFKVIIPQPEEAP
jgi:signal transduction histidine kinase/putative methionine-R-sulfoxide reductase with GAF domain